MKTQKTALFLALALASGVALAERGAADLQIPLATSTGTSDQNSFEKLDLDNDSRLSHDEAEAGTLPRIFLFMDRNHDGVLSRQEFNYRER
ncbi:hypothetical protein QLQ85_11465 [Halomonas sp. M4R5S39]|uniref:hypothetical protein n=1 Tax=Halomonas kalidii TaxID=3043293 RepID=UPI0024A93D1C|nr:hypothetical protein [Halomonas kalidii]MDI5985407.1 hypothetical protein [Halomonas kalidii]